MLTRRCPIAAASRLADELLPGGRQEEKEMYSLKAVLLLMGLGLMGAALGRIGYDLYQAW